MKKTFIVSLMMFVACSILAQENYGFKKFDVKKDFTENGFAWFHDAELLAADNNEQSNVPQAPV